MSERLILGGTIIDGTGQARREMDIRLTGDTIAEIGDLAANYESSGIECIDAHGKIVAPGFIDMHTHSDIALLGDPDLLCKLSQGITFELLGQDGMSVAPLTDATAAQWRQHLQALTGDYGVEWTWRSFESYLDSFGPTAANAGSLVGHGTIRLNVMGMENRPASAREIDAMGDLLRDALDAGAFGLSGGLVYTPGSYAHFDELVALNRIVAEADRLWVVHIRFEGDRIRDGMNEMFRLVDETGVKLHISHFKVMGRSNWGRGRELVQEIGERQAVGYDITVDQYPYDAGSTMLTAALPPWANERGTEGLKQLLKDERALDRMERDIQSGTQNWEGFVALSGWENITIADVGAEDRLDAVGMTVVELGERWSMTPIRAAARLLLEYDLGVAIVIHAMNEADVIEILRSPARLGGTDALLGGKPHPRAYGSYPRILGRYCRQLGALSLELAVHQMTGAAAARLGIHDRGVLSPGNKADLCIFNEDLIADRATYENPCQLSEGIEWVLVNGQPVLHQNALTGIRPGSLIRA